jgi:hypothetical protein
MTIQSTMLSAAFSGLMLIGACGAAKADSVVLNTIDTTFDRDTGWPLQWLSINDVAIKFSSPRAGNITNIVAYLAAPDFANDTIGIMGDAGGLPDGTFLYSDPAPLFWENTSPVTLSGLKWAISAGTTYWLTVVADQSYVDGHGMDSYWSTGNAPGPVGYFSSDLHSWFIEDASYVTLPEAEILATTVPEPSTWAMMLLGFAGLGYAGYRRARAGHAALTAYATSGPN